MIVAVKVTGPNGAVPAGFATRATVGATRILASTGGVPASTACGWISVLLGVSADGGVASCGTALSGVDG
ncbi:MAG: hypothetical protein ACJ72N_07825 [Labedaea sp.]